MFANQYVRPVVEFGEGPDSAQGRGLFREIWSRVQGARTHPYGAEKSDPSITWNGVAQSPQDFKGFNAPMSGGVPYRNGGFAHIDSGLIEGPMGDPARRIFAQRLKRQNSVGGMG
jgi:hypothetical protein